MISLQTADQRSAPIKRARDSSPERPSKRSEPAHDQCQSVLFAYPFVLSLVTNFLSDLNAACLVTACKAMKPIVSQFVLYRAVTQAFADEIIDPSRMSCFQASRIDHATHCDLRKHRHLTRVQLDDRFNSPLQPGYFTDQLERVKFGADFNQSVDGMLPEGLDQLWLGNAFNQPITPLSLPSSITVLVFADSFNQPLRLGDLPSSLRTLIFGRNFNFPIPPGVLPPTLERLQIRGVASQPLIRGALPPSLHTLALGVHFSHPILPGVLPRGLVKLFLDFRFNHPLVANVIPDTVSHLTVSGCFDQALLPGVIPSSVVQLQLEKDYR